MGVLGAKVCLKPKISVNEYKRFMFKTGKQWVKPKQCFLSCKSHNFKIWLVQIEFIMPITMQGFTMIACNETEPLFDYIQGDYYVLNIFYKIWL
jgi:hypothetical protein